jgi:hypothetical protein
MLPLVADVAAMLGSADVWAAVQLYAGLARRKPLRP